MFTKEQHVHRDLFLAKHLLLLSLTIFLALALSARAQSPTPTNRNTLTEEIKQLAESDAKLDKAPQSTQDLNSLFGEEAVKAGITLREVLRIYEEAYQIAKANRPWWKSLQRNVVSITAFILLIPLIFHEFIKKTASSLLEEAKKRIYNRFAGSRLFRGAALRKYKKALIEKFKRVIITFRPDRPLNMRELYVPLKVKGASDIDLVDAYKALSHHRRLMIVGSPGSGKSMLLKHLTLSYLDVESRLINTLEKPVPILLELSRLNSGDKSIQDALVDVLRLNEFPQGGRFVNLGLKNGYIVLLLDGLDEVNSSRRDQVVGQIIDLLGEYKNCRVFITCRNAVYRDEFVGVVDQTLEIVEFNDQQVQKFLSSWQQYMPEGKTIEQLIGTLRDRPRIMALARNPLLLTIIAFLYTDTDFVLPHSRSEFYDQAVDMLLLQWKGKQNLHKAPHKRLVLQHLALFNQDGGTHNEQDRRSIDLKTALREIKQLLPDLNLKEEVASTLLDEIVERSGLLLSIDAGTKFQFAHLTLQEYFAATALAGNSIGLIDRFRKDKDAWRETVKLWCGLDQDSTDFIRAIYEIDSITAFECLADAQKVSSTLADEILGVFKPKLGVDGSANDRIVVAFAAVASDMRPRGQAIFNFLSETLNIVGDEDRLRAAATAISMTNLNKAAHLLSEYAADHPDVEKALVRMGDLAVPFLQAKALNGQRGAFKALGIIGTPQAAKSLATLLWENDLNVAAEAAMCLGAMLHNSDITDTLRVYPLTNLQLRKAWYKWVWEPFDDPATSSLRAICGRIAHLIESFSQSVQDYTSAMKIDSRIIIPLLVRLVQNGMIDIPDLSEDGPIKELAQFEQKVKKNDSGYTIQRSSVLSQSEYDRKIALNRIEDALERGTRLHSSIDPAEIASVKQLLLSSYFSRVKVNQAYWLLSCLPSTSQYDFIYLLGKKSPTATMDDWRNICRPIKYQFETGMHFRIVLFLILGVTIISLTELFGYVDKSSTWMSQKNGILMLALISLLLGWFRLWRGASTDTIVTVIFGFVFFPLLLVTGMIDFIASGIRRELDTLDLEESVEYLPFSGFTPLIGYATTSFMLKKWSLLTVIGIWLILIGVSVALWVIGSRKERRAQNPLRILLEELGADNPDFSFLTK